MAFQRALLFSILHGVGLVMVHAWYRASGEAFSKPFFVSFSVYSPSFTSPDYSFFPFDTCAMCGSDMRTAGGFGGQSCFVDRRYDLSDSLVFPQLFVGH